MKLSLPVTTFAALAVLLESTDLVHAKRLAEPEPLSAAEASPLEPRDLSMVSVYDVPATRDAGTFKEKNKQLPPPGVYGVDPDAEEESDASNQGQDFETHIVGGTQADLGEYPYFVDMNVVGCGGALIAPQVVMSAAHCGDTGNEYVNQRVIVGAYRDNTSTTTGASSVTVTAQRNHPNYDDNSMENDFMLLRLGTAVNIATPKLSIATSGGASSPAAGTSLTVIGVGATSQGGSGASTLREVVVPVVDVNECNDLYEGGIATDVMFCAGNVANGGIDSCQGDSGGPIVFKKSSTEHTHVGVVSWGNGCALAGYPGVYANVGSVNPWIKSVVCDEWRLSADFCGNSGNSGTAPVAAPVAAPTAAPLCGSVKLEVRTDGWAAETSVDFKDRAGNVIFAKAAGQFRNWTTEIFQKTCVDLNGCNVLKVLDSYGDGLDSPAKIIFTLDGVTRYEGRDYGSGKQFNIGYGCA